MHLKIRFEHILFAGPDSWLGNPSGRWNSLIRAESRTWAAVKSSGFNMIMTTEQISSKIQVHLLWRVMELRAGDAAAEAAGGYMQISFHWKSLRSRVGFRCVHSGPADSSTAWQENKAFYKC